MLTDGVNLPQFFEGNAFHSHVPSSNGPIQGEYDSASYPETMGKMDLSVEQESLSTYGD
jgi:hypothetical protein